MRQNLMLLFFEDLYTHVVQNLFYCSLPHSYRSQKLSNPFSQDLGNLTRSS